MPNSLGKPNRARERRVEARYVLTASVALMDAASGAKIDALIGDLAWGGCHVPTNTPFRVGTVTDIRIGKGKHLFKAAGRVVYSLAGKGMGLVFTAIEPKQAQILKKLLEGCQEASWVTNRRRNQRILMQIPVRVSGYQELGSSFEEKTHTTVISPRGTVVRLSTPVRMGQRLVLSNIQTRAVMECVVAYRGRPQGDNFEVGLQFGWPTPTFWGVAFPPADWSPQHPDAKSR